MIKIYIERDIEKGKEIFRVMEKGEGCGICNIDCEMAQFKTENEAIAHKEELVKSEKYVFIGFDYLRKSGK